MRTRHRPKTSFMRALPRSIFRNDRHRRPHAARFPNHTSMGCSFACPILENPRRYHAALRVDTISMLDQANRANADNRARLWKRDAGQANAQRVAHRLNAGSLHRTEPLKLRHHFILLPPDAVVKRATRRFLFTRHRRELRLAKVDPYFEPLRTRRI